MIRWTHGHSLFSGMVFGGVFLSHNEWLLIGIPSVFGVGVLVGRFWAMIDWMAGAVREKVLRARRDRGLSRPVKMKPIDVDRYGEFPRGY